MNEPETLDRYMHQAARLIETELHNVFPSGWDVPDHLMKSMRYSLFAGGKRLRPILVMSAVEALGGDMKASIPAACAIEMIHTYSLIHDDLPAMDDDDFRRGKPTNHKVFGEAMAILAGDALLTHAFFAVSQLRKHGVSANAIVSIVEELSSLAGANGMVGGQAADILGEQGISGLAELEYIHLRKTADMIVSSLRVGGRIAGADEAQLEALTQFGYSIGLAFQIQDDILDVIGDEHKLGKQTNSDAEHHKVTYPYLMGLEQSKNKVHELTSKGKEAILKGSFVRPKLLLDIADYLVSRDH